MGHPGGVPSRKPGEDRYAHLEREQRWLLRSPERVRLTNTYLSAEEYEVFLALPATELATTRWQSHLAGRPTSVDVFHGELDGLVLAEVELREDEDPLPMPEGVSADVTDDDRFSGAALSRCSADRLRSALVDMLSPVRAASPTARPRQRPRAYESHAAIAGSVIRLGVRAAPLRTARRRHDLGPNEAR